jgi:hypothetical protein
MCSQASMMCVCRGSGDTPYLQVCHTVGAWGSRLIVVLSDLGQACAPGGSRVERYHAPFIQRYALAGQCNPLARPGGSAQPLVVVEPFVAPKQGCVRRRDSKKR